MTTDEKLNQLIDMLIRYCLTFSYNATDFTQDLERLKESTEVKEKEFDPTKPVQTRDGRKARIICTDLKDTKPLVVLVARENGIEDIQTYTMEGKFFCIGDDPRDLINI